jgi:hypothetical protein
MRNLLIAGAAGALLTAALPAAAAATDQTSAPRARTDAASQQVNEDDPERRICVAIELTGSRMIRRVCRTQREWDARGGLETNR